MFQVKKKSVANQDIGAIVCFFSSYALLPELKINFLLLSDCPQNTKVSSDSKSSSGTGKRGRGGSSSSSRGKRGGKGGKKKSAFAAADDC